MTILRLASGISILSTAEKIILTVSGIIALAIFLVTDPVVFSADSHAYLLYADAISKFTVNPVVYSRQAGYPLLLVATLYPWTLSVIPVLAIQAICAALTPWVIYKTLRYISHNIALCGAWFSIASLLPYNFQTYLFPDPMQVFLSILFCYCVVSFSFKRTTKTMIWMFLVYLALSFFRPPFLLFYIIIATVVGIAAWQDRKNWMVYFKPFVMMTVLVFSVHLSASALDAHLYKKIGVKRKILSGKMIFLNAFTRSTGVKDAFTDGKYTTIFRQKLVSFFQDAPTNLRDLRIIGGPWFAEKFDAYKSDPEKLVTAILNTRDNSVWGVLFNISENWFGNRAGDKLFKHVALEQYRYHPKILLNVVSTGLDYYLGIRACQSPLNYPDSDEYTCRFWPAYYPVVYETFGNPHYGIITGMRPHILHLMNPHILEKIITPFSTFVLKIWPRVYRIVLPIESFLTLLILCYACFCILLRKGTQDMQKDLKVLSVVLTVFFLYSIPMFMLTDPQFRYVSAGALFLVMSGTISLGVLIKRFNKIILIFFTLTANHEKL